LLLFVKLTDSFLLFRALINITKDDGRSLFITMPVIHQMAPLYLAAGKTLPEAICFTDAVKRHFFLVNRPTRDHTADRRRVKTLRIWHK